MEIAKNQKVANRIVEVMVEARPRSLRAFALSLNIDPSLFTKITKGERAPNRTIIDAVVKQYNVNEKWLLTGEGEMYKTPQDRTRHNIDGNGVPDQNAEYVEFLKSNDAFFKTQYNTFNQQVLANLTALIGAQREIVQQQRNLEALVKINLEHTGNVEALQRGVEPAKVHDEINRDILSAAGVENDNAVGSPGKG